VTDLEINEAIADHVGLSWYAVEKSGWYYRSGGHGYTNQIHEAGRYTKDDAMKELCKGEPMSVVRIPVPDFVNDLSAMHEAEKVLNEKQEDIMNSTLWDIMGGRKYLWHATASQRAEALLRTVGKWKEAKP
jgi:hypothetical protein